MVPLNLVYVADLSKKAKLTKEEARDLAIYRSKIKTPDGDSGDAENRWDTAGAGFISQNVYLYCALEGLSTVVCGLFDMEALGKVLSLCPGQRVILTQSVGYPRKK